MNQGGMGAYLPGTLGNACASSANVPHPLLNPIFCLCRDEEDEPSTSGRFGFLRY